MWVSIRCVFHGRPVIIINKKKGANAHFQKIKTLNKISRVRFN
jgi:hypothetical protein